MNFFVTQFSNYTELGVLTLSLPNSISAEPYATSSILEIGSTNNKLVLQPSVWIGGQEILANSVYLWYSFDDSTGDFIFLYSLTEDGDGIEVFSESIFNSTTSFVVNFAVEGSNIIVGTLDTLIKVDGANAKTKARI